MIIPRRQFLGNMVFFASAATLPKTKHKTTTYYIIARADPDTYGPLSGWTFTKSDLPEHAYQLYFYEYKCDNHKVIPNSFKKIWAKPQENIDLFLLRLSTLGYDVQKMIITPGTEKPVFYLMTKVDGQYFYVKVSPNIPAHIQGWTQHESK